MKKIRRALVMTLAFAMLLSMLAACGGGNNSAGTSAPANSAETSTSAPAQETAAPSANEPGGEAEPPSSAAEKSLTVGTSALHLYFNTAGSTESDTIARQLIYDQIFYIDNVTGELSSDILSGYEWEDDVTLRLDLKDGVYFSDGTQMTGEDILYTLQMYVANSNAEIEFFQRIDYDASYVADDGLTTYLVYSEVYGAALSTLCVPVQSKAFFEAYPDGDDAWWYSPLGSGPYVVGQVTMGTSVELIRRDDYWNPESTYEADTITIKFYSDSTAQYADYVAGVLDVIVNVSENQIDQLSALDNTEVVIQSANDVAWLVFNESAVQPEVREAIAYAVDWDALGIVNYGNLSIPATSHFATTFAAYTDHGKVYEYNPERAKQILEDAGISGLVFNQPCPSFGTAMPEALQFYLGQIGIEVNVEAMDIPTLIPRMITGDGDISGTALEVHGNAPKEPNTCLSTLAIDGFKIMSISDPEFNDMLNQGLATTNENERVEIYKKVDQWLYDNYQAFPIAERAEAFCYNTDKIASMSMASVLRASFSSVVFK